MTDGAMVIFILSGIVCFALMLLAIFGIVKVFDASDDRPLRWTLFQVGRLFGRASRTVTRASRSVQRDFTDGRRSVED